MTDGLDGLATSSWEKSQMLVMSILTTGIATARNHEDRISKIERRIAGWALLFFIGGAIMQLVIHLYVPTKLHPSDPPAATAPFRP